MRHLDTCQYSTFIKADVPRVECREHGIQSRAISCGLAKKKKEPVQDIGVDETSSKKGHYYLTIVHDKATGNVIQVDVGRNTETIDGFYEAWQDHLWPAFIGRTRMLMRRYALIGSIAGFFGKAVDQVRKREHRDLKADRNDLLKGTKYDWLRNRNNPDDRTRRWFIELTRENLKTARASAIKETASMLWKYKSKTWAEKAWRNLFGWMWRSRLSPMVDLAKSLRKHFYGIMNSIMLGIDNGMANKLPIK